jgi:hypothetical protein
MHIFLRTFTWSIVAGTLCVLWITWMILTHLPQIIFSIIAIALVALVIGCELIIHGLRSLR